MSTVETAIGRFGWHDHRSPDPKAAQRFYTELLGWELEIFPMGEFEYPMIKANDQTHGGFGPVDGDEPAHWLGNIVTDDVDAAAARATSAGGNLLVEPSDIQGVGRWAVASDPQGAVFALFQSIDAPPTSEGVFVWDELGTTDIEGAKRFYAEVVGWEASEQDMGDGFMYTIFRSNGVDRAGAYQKRPDMPGAAGAGSPTSPPTTSTPASSGRRARALRRSPRRWTSPRSAGWRSSRIPRAQRSGSTSRKRPSRNRRAGATSSRPRRPRRYSPIRHKWAASSHIWMPARAR